MARGWGFIVSLIKFKGIVAGIGADISVLASISMEGGIIDLVEEFSIGQHY